MVNQSAYLVLSGLLFTIGLSGVLTRRSPISFLISIEIILNAANLNFVAFSAFSPVKDLGGQFFALVMLGIAGAEAAVALALVMEVYRQLEKVDIEQINEVRE